MASKQVSLDFYSTGATRKSLSGVLANGKPEILFDFNSTTRGLERDLANYLPITMNDNSHYEKLEYLHSFVDMCKARMSSHGFHIHNTLSISNDVSAAKRKPSGRSLRDRVERTDFECIKDGFSTYNALLLRNVRMRHKGQSRGVTVAIDYTNMPYFGNENTPMICGSKDYRGTNKVYKYLVASIIIGEYTYVGCVREISPLNNNKEVLIESMLNDIRTYFRIDLVLMDREFQTYNVIKLLNRMGIHFLMPVPMREWLKRAMVNHRHGDVMHRSMKKKHHIPVKYQIVFWKHDNGKLIPFASNLGEDELCKEKYWNKYRERWRIETMFRVIKNDILPKTSAKNYRYRYFLFMLSACLYNIWMLVRYWLKRKQVPDEERKMFTVKIFLELIKKYVEMDFG